MNPDRLNARERLNGAAVERGGARLNGWGIRFDLYSITNGCGATDIIQSAPEYVLGILYDVPTRLVIAENQQRSRMDEIEGARPGGNGNYQRLTVNVDFQGSNIEAITYAGTRRGESGLQLKLHRNNESALDISVTWRLERPNSTFPMITATT
jgi:hypothetical protein